MSFVKITRYVILLALLNSLSIAFAARLDGIEMTQQANKLTLLFKMNAPVKYKVFTLHHPERVVVDLEPSSLGFDLRQIKTNSLVRYVRVGHPTKTSLRIVFDVTQPVFSSVSSLKAGRGLHVEVHPLAGGAQAASRERNIPQKTTYISHAPKTSSRDVVVVIDPGHGGKDPGAIGLHYSKEKNVVLAIAQLLKRQIDAQPGMRAVLTRHGDYYVGLRERMAIARKYNGDIFVAIHADAYGNHQSHGASVFALSQLGATSEAARWLAEKENYSELGGVNLKGLDDRNGEIRTVLIDLSQTATISASLQMGHQVLYGLNQLTTLHSPKVEQARFMVLKSPDIPSILIETGFISNPREEMNLNSRAYQLRLTQAIFTGIKNYFWRYPPHGSLIEAMSDAKRRLADGKSSRGRKGPWT